MPGLYEKEDYIQNSIITSRIIQEESAALQGASGYGVLAELIDRNIEKIDGMAEYIGQCVAQNNNLEMYKQQYGEGFVKGFLKRGFIGKEAAEANEVSRRNMAFLQSFLVETGIKNSARFVIKWASERDKYLLFKQIYSILFRFTYDDEIGAGNKRRTQLELKKIRDSFPLSKSDKKKLAQLDIKGDILNIDMNIEFGSDNSKMRETVSYLLYALYAQKYEEREEAESLLLDYYSILGYSGMMAKEMVRENANQYNHIACDQTRYLKIARGMVKNFDTCIPTIKIDSLAERAVQMSQYDPYFLPRMRSSSVSSVKRKKRISDVFFENPEMVMHAGITALSQLQLDDNSKESIRGKFIDWGIDGDTSDIIVEQSDVIRENASDIID